MSMSDLVEFLRMLYAFRDSGNLSDRQSRMLEDAEYVLEHEIACEANRRRAIRAGHMP